MSQVEIYSNSITVQLNQAEGNREFDDPAMTRATEFGTDPSLENLKSPTATDAMDSPRGILDLEESMVEEDSDVTVSTPTQVVVETAQEAESLDPFRQIIRLLTPNSTSSGSNTDSSEAGFATSPSNEGTTTPKETSHSPRLTIQAAPEEVMSPFSNPIEEMINLLTPTQERLVSPISFESSTRSPTPNVEPAESQDQYYFVEQEIGTGEELLEEFELVESEEDVEVFEKSKPLGRIVEEDETALLLDTDSEDAESKALQIPSSLSEFLANLKAWTENFLVQTQEYAVQHDPRSWTLVGEDETARALDNDSEGAASKALQIPSSLSEFLFNLKAWTKGFLVQAQEYVVEHHPRSWTILDPEQEPKLPVSLSELFSNVQTSIEETADQIQENAQHHPRSWTIIGVIFLCILANQLVRGNSSGSISMRWWRYTVHVHSPSSSSIGHDPTAILNRVEAVVRQEFDETLVVSTDSLESTSPASILARVTEEFEAVHRETPPDVWDFVDEHWEQTREVAVQWYQEQAPETLTRGVEQVQKLGSRVAQEAKASVVQWYREQAAQVAAEYK